MTPAFFLVLLLLADDKKKYQYFVCAGFAFFAYLFVQYINVPDMFTSAIQNAFAVVSERGTIVPSTFTLISDVFNFTFFWKYHPLVVAYVIWGMYLHEIFSWATVPGPAPLPNDK